MSMRTEEYKLRAGKLHKIFVQDYYRIVWIVRRSHGTVISRRYTADNSDAEEGFKSTTGETGSTDKTEDRK